jgi:VDE lipocalin domain
MVQRCGFLRLAIVASSWSIAFGFSPGFLKQAKLTTCCHMASKDEDNDTLMKQVAAAALGLTLAATTMFGGVALAADKSYDGFASYAKENQMQQSDVGCFMNKCGDQTKALFSNPRGIKGVTCLGRCKGEQNCAMQVRRLLFYSYRSVA